MDDYYEEEEAVNDELKRLQEVTEIDGNNSDEDEDEFYDTIAQDKLNTGEPPKNQDLTLRDVLADLSQWTWEAKRSDRLLAAAKFLRQSATVFKILSQVSEASVLGEARKRKAEAGAQAFRNARIVGATVVGASRRLEAIRAAGPFGVVVEEACEVIEPTLMSVLACNTLRKLELIGDQRQLPAFVQQCWFSFETTMPSLKTSLFERLVSGTVKRGSQQKKQLKGKNLKKTLIRYFWRFC